MISNKQRRGGGGGRDSCWDLVASRSDEAPVSHMMVEAVSAADVGTRHAGRPTVAQEPRAGGGSLAQVQAGFPPACLEVWRLWRTSSWEGTATEPGDPKRGAGPAGSGQRLRSRERTSGVKPREPQEWTWGGKPARRRPLPERGSCLLTTCVCSVCMMLIWKEREQHYGGFSQAS